jgi:uncharacterized protein YjdB
MDVSDTIQLTALIVPSNATDKTVTWTSSDSNIATVSDKGFVTAKGKGKAIITAKSSNGKTSTCEINVE